MIEHVCRLVRILLSPHECGHALIVAEGSPGVSVTLARLAAHLCGYSVVQINPSVLTSAEKYEVETFQADLVAYYTRAGVKVSGKIFVGSSRNKDNL